MTETITTQEPAQTNRTTVRPRSHLSALIFALLAVMVVALQVVHFSGRDYRQDEAWFTYAAIEHTLPGVVRWVSNDIHPPLWLATADIWIDQFGHHEDVTRFMSKLYTLLALALVFRLAADLFNREVGLFAVLLLGTMPFTQFYLYEFRPYPLLTVLVIGLHVAFLRWLRRPRLLYAVLTAAIGSAVIYTHYFGVFVLLGIALFFAIATRPDRKRWLQAVGLAGVVAVSYLPWLPVVFNLGADFNATGITYAIPTDSEIFSNLHDLMYLPPRGIGILLLVIGLLIPASVARLRRWHDRHGRTLFRSGANWRTLLLVGVPVTVLVSVLVVNTSYNLLNQRNLIVIVPSLLIFVAYAITTLPPYARYPIIGFLVLMGITNPRDYEPPKGDFSGVVDYIRPFQQPHDPILLDAAWNWQHVVIGYYLHHRLPNAVENADFFHVFDFLTDRELQTLPVMPAQHTLTDAPQSLAAFTTWLDGASQVWHVREGNGTNSTESFEARLLDSYAVVREEFIDPYAVTLYRRIPDDLTGAVVFDSQFVLYGSFVRNFGAVRACNTLRVESWWQAAQQPDRTFGVSLSLVNRNESVVVQRLGIPSYELTENWTVGQLYGDLRLLPVPCGTPAGDYQVRLAMIDPNNRQTRLTGVDISGQRLPDNQFVVATVTVE